MEMWCFISALTHYIIHRKWSSPPDVGLEQLYTILSGVYLNRILQSTTTLSLKNLFQWKIIIILTSSTNV